jgi:hypothetical protein
LKNGLTKQKGGIDNDDQSLAQQIGTLNISSESDSSESLSSSIISNDNYDSGSLSKEYGGPLTDSVQGFDNLEPAADDLTDKKEPEQIGMVRHLA